MKLMKPDKSAAPRRGRPRAFDAETVLDRALQVFWRKGFDGTSLSDLTRAMGINRPSIYAAFGDKRALFCKVLDRYAQGPAGFVREALSEPTSRAVVARLLRAAADMHTDPRGPRGCLMVQGALAAGGGGTAVRRELIARRAADETMIRKRLERAKSERDLSADSSPADLARYVVTVIRGMAVQAAGGASREELRRVTRMALRAWPR